MTNDVLLNCPEMFLLKSFRITSVRSQPFMPPDDSRRQSQGKRREPSVTLVVPGLDCQVSKSRDAQAISENRHVCLFNLLSKQNDVNKHVQHYIY